MISKPHQIRTVAVYLRLAVASHRKRLMGIFKYMGASVNWNLSVVGTEAEFNDLLRADAPFPPDGVISADPQSSETERLLMASSLPFVGIGLDSNALAARTAPTCLIRADNADIGETAAHYLTRSGTYRSYAFVPDQHNLQWSRDRHRSFASVLAAQQIPCRPFDVRTGTFPSQQALEAFLLSLAKPAAVFASWDGRALEVLNAARSCGIRVPNDLSVLSVDNDELICENSTPPLSSIQPDTEGMGFAAARALDRMMSSPRRHRHMQIIHCPIVGIVARESIQAPSPVTHIITRALRFIDQECTHELTPSDVAEHLRISRRLLDLRFHQYADTSVQEAILRARVKVAQNLLATTIRPVKTILSASGFRSVCHAQRAFKRITGLTPGAWRVRANASAPRRPRSP